MNAWRLVTLDDVAREVTVGHVGPMATEYVEAGIPFLRSQNVVPHGFSMTDVKFISADFHSRLRKSQLNPGDVVTVRTGKPGATAVVPAGWESANCSDLVITRPGPELDSRWLSYYLNGAAAGFISSQLVGAVQQHFNVGAARSMRLLLPEIREQQAIAEVLGALDDKIAANSAVSSSIEDLLATSFLATGMDVEPSPGTSRLCLSDVIELNPKVAPPLEQEPIYVDMQKLPVTGLTIDGWTRRPAKGGARFQNGDTLLARITPCLENRKTGYVDFLDDGQAAVGSTEYIVMRSRPAFPKVLSFFLATSPRFRAFAIRHMVGSSGRQRVSAADLSEYRLSGGNASALQRFDELSSGLLTLLTSLASETRCLRNTRDALLPLLMSGSLCVRDAERQVEGVV